MGAISRSWKILGNNTALATKLSVRLAKSLAQGVREGSITASVLERHAQVIDELEKIVNGQSASVENAAISEHLRVWEHWAVIKLELGDREQAVLKARERLSRLPMFKKPA